MKFLKQGVCLALLGAGLSAAPTTLASQAAAAPAPTGDGLVSQLTAEADGNVSIKDNPATGRASFVRATGTNADLLPGVAGDSAAKAGSKADSFLDGYGALLGAAPGELVRQSVSSSSAGWTVTYTQIHDGVQVFGSAIKANVDSDGDLTAVNGYAAPGIDVSTKPTFSAAEIGKRAVSFVKSDPPTAESGGAADVTGLRATDSQLVIYRIGLLKGLSGKNVLAWSTVVTNDAVRDQLIYDAHTGKILNRWSLNTDALDRELREATGTAENPVFTTVWEEGDLFPGTLNIDQQNLINSSGESYWLYENAFDRDSYDGAGAKRITVNNDPRINCPNANWNGITTNYCDGVTSDDVVAHEWGHAYTQFTSGLIYQYQSGALNESYSDVWGETLDMVNGREDEGETFDVKRPDGECDPTAPPKLLMSITAPAAQAGACTPVAAGFSEAFTTTPVNATVVAALDAENADGPTPTDGCTAYNNAAAVADKWAYVDRGTCTFQVKVDMAVAAGADGIVIGNNVQGLPPNPAGTAPAGFYGVTVTQADGTRFKEAGTASVTIQAEDISGRTPSTRWLMGEKSTAFGGAIRDMWTPTCYGNPGKVTDAEYNCDPGMTDHGGVHGNSGVPNHAYALAVDGGTYNGQTITGMGLDKAASIWWRAQTAYLTPSSNFTEFATALASSCTDLIGDDIRELTTTPNASPTLAAPITAGDCTQLDKVITAVELTNPVTECNYQPVLQPGSPAPCGAGFTTETVFTEDFEDGLTGWTPSSQLVFGLGAPWEAESAAPGGHAGGVAYGPAPDRGQCDSSPQDFSGRDSITSPAIAIPAAATQGLRLTFDHYVATEGTVDGGNVKVSINGGAFTKVPAAAYTFNKPGKLLSAAAGNTNPMQGEDAFSGTDGGQSRGSWGTSQLNLGATGVSVKAGDTIKLRLDVGRDGCGGIDGWYVDNIQVSYCKAPPVTPPAATSVVASASPKKIVKGKSFKAIVSVATASGIPSGTVQIYKGSKLLGTGTLGADGKVTIKIKKKLAKKLKVGKNTLTAKYLGSSTLQASQDDFVVKVKKKKHRR
ncbi:M4 family metallopeptidase [Nocardioides halotolerans]|uniref:M4 family metallopeptidase n=1 Tax=Nocardioides halotolerans TaxID=433660 RepID=UPI0004073086|nr:M4 family metallopeptidase [Nocardioides halotolerans]